MASQDMGQRWEAGTNSTQDIARNLSPPESGHTKDAVGYFRLQLANLRVLISLWPPSSLLPII